MGLNLAEALGALGNGIQGGYNAYDIQKRRQDAEDQRKQDEADRADALAERKRVIQARLATNNAQYRVFDKGRASDAADNGASLAGAGDMMAGAPGLDVGLPFAMKAAGDSVAQAGKQPSVYDQNIDYGTLLEGQRADRAAADRKENTMANRAMTQSYRDSINQDRDAARAETTRLHDAGVAAAASMTAHAPAARAYLQSKGVDPAMFDDKGAVDKAGELGFKIAAEKYAPARPAGDGLAGIGRVYDDAAGRAKTLRASVPKVRPPNARDMTMDVGGKPTQMNKMFDPGAASSFVADSSAKDQAATNAEGVANSLLGQELGKLGGGNFKAPPPAATPPPPGVTPPLPASVDQKRYVSDPQYHAWVNQKLGIK
jgi:hypothetical protein